MQAQELLELRVPGSWRTGGLRDTGGGVRRENREKEGGRGTLSGPESPVLAEANASPSLLFLNLVTG